MTVYAIGTVGALTDLATICLHVGALWPHPPTVIEADPDGGRLAVRHNWELRPSLVDFVRTSNRNDQFALRPETAVRRLRSGVGIVVGPPAIESMSAAIAGLVQMIDALETHVDSDVLVDVGIIRPDSPCGEIVARATRRIIVVRKDVEDIVSLAHRRALLESLGDWFVLTAGGRLRVDEAADSIQWPIIADLLPHDRKSSAKLRVSLERFAVRPDRSRSPQPV